MQPRRTANIDGFTRTLPRQRELRVPPRPDEASPLVMPAIASKPTKPKPVQPRAGWKSRVQWVVIMASGLLAGLVMQAIPLGYLAVAVYGLIALIKRIPSRFTFVLALCALLVAPAGIVIGSGPVANGFALIGFLLSSVGVVTLAIELKKERRTAHIEHGTGQ